MIRLGFDDDREPHKDSRSFDKLRQRFCARLALLHSMIANQWRHDIFCWDYRGPVTCCGVFLAVERAFVLKRFTWPESYLIQIEHKKTAPDKDFFLAVLRVTERRMPLTAIEKKSVNKLNIAVRAKQRR